MTTLRPGPSPSPAASPDSRGRWPQSCIWERKAHLGKEMVTERASAWQVHVRSLRGQNWACTCAAPKGPRRESSGSQPREPLSPDPARSTPLGYLRPMTAEPTAPEGLPNLGPSHRHAAHERPHARHEWPRSAPSLRPHLLPRTKLRGELWTEAVGGCPHADTKLLRTPVLTRSLGHTREIQQSPPLPAATVRGSAAQSPRQSTPGPQSCRPDSPPQPPRPQGSCMRTRTPPGAHAA